VVEEKYINGSQYPQDQLDVQRFGGWIMDNDIQATKTVNWKRCTQDRYRWKSTVEQAKTHIEL
jgi:hypothetical protein